MALELGASSTGVVNTAAGNITLGGVVSGVNGIIKQGSSTLTLSGNNTYSGATTISAGTLAVSGTGQLGGGNYSQSIANSGNFIYASTSNQTLSGVISGTGALTKNAASTLTLSGANTYTGTTTISAGTLTISGTGQLGGGSYAGAIANSGNFIYASTANQTLSGIISGTGALTKNGTGTLTLTAANTYTGGTTVSAGTLKLGNRTNASASVAGTTTLSGGNLSYDYSAANFGVNGAITLTAESTITKLNGAFQINLQSGTLNGGGQTLNVYVDTTAGTAPLYFNQTAGTSLGQVNILNGAVGQDGNNGIPLRNAAINVSSGAQFVTWGNPTLNNNITLNGGAGPDSNGALYAASGSPNYTGTITLAASTNSSIGNSASGFTISGQVTGGGSLTKIGTGNLTLSGNNTYSGNTTISAGRIEIAATGRLGAGTYAGNISNNATLVYSGTNAQTLSGIISGTGALTQNAASTLTLSGNNTYSGGTTLNTGTLVIGNTAAAGTGTITQTSGSSLLKIDTTGTIANNMSVYNVQASQSATLSGAITVNNATWEVDSGDTLTVSGNLSGTGGVTKNGTGTLVLSGSNSNTGATTVNTGTLTAASANALGSTSSVVVSNGGSLLVTAGDSVNDSAGVTLAGGTLAVNGTFNESVGLLTLSANSIIDLGGFTGTLRFGGVGSWASNTTLAIWNWNGINHYGNAVGNGANNRHVVFSNNSDLGAYLDRISFYSDNGSSFAGAGFEQAFSGGGTEIIAVPEPEAYVAGILLVLSSAIWLWRRRIQKA
jgi:autotransporter-associated beta strand protein